MRVDIVISHPKNNNEIIYPSIHPSIYIYLFIYLFIYSSVYQTAVADVINEEFARLGKDVEQFSPIMSKCSKQLNTSSEACQACLQTVECGR